MTKVYVSFGQIHTHSINGKTLDKDSIAVIRCESYKEGRELAFKWFKGLFHNCWSEEEFNDKILMYFPRGCIEVNPMYKSE